MSKKRIYISGPIAGQIAGNKHLFNWAEWKVNTLHYEAVNPHNIAPCEHEGSMCPEDPPIGEDHAIACRRRANLAELVTCDIIFLLNGWKDSPEACIEFFVAQTCGLRIFEQSTWGIDPCTANGVLMIVP